MDTIETSYNAAIAVGKINGAVLCATNAAGTFTSNTALGTRTLLSGEKIAQDLSDVLFLASATKILTTIAALQCVEDGLLTLTGDLSTLAPELASKQVLTGFAPDGETPILENATRNITLEMLLTHSSGLAYHFLHADIGKWREKFAPQNETARGLTVEELFSYPLAFQPGSSWMYGPGLDWAGRIIERATGRTLLEFMQKRIFDPLDITDAQFYLVTRPELRERLVDLNPDDPDAVGRAVLGGGTGGPNSRTRGDFGGQGLFMSGQSFIKVLHSILANDGTLLAPRTVEDMFTEHLSPEAKEGHQAALASPGGIFFRVGVDPEMKMGHGLGGLLTLESVQGWYGERTLTWGGGLTLTWFIDRENDLCGVGAVQASLPVDGKVAMALKQTFRRDIYRKYAAWRG
ncbi:serine hydrolase domain-containing protein [Aspergillus lucknowensis]|uniref:Beta-lactamase/transpeptidase-like protein n=1 Tax=Aspergillus lucknowensis TaxID=176173 RepID=A0ABR4M1D4_9EURO